MDKKLQTKGDAPQLKSAPNIAVLTERYRSLMVNYANTRVNDYQIAEDLVQDTLIAIHKSKSTFRGDCSEKTYLMTILNRKIIDFYRKRGRRPVVFEDPVSDETFLHNTVATNSNPSEQTSNRELIKQLGVALGSMPARSKRVFQLYVIEQKTAKEVSLQLGITVSQVWVSCHRSRKFLREYFRKEGLDTSLSFALY